MESHTSSRAAETSTIDPPGWRKSSQADHTTPPYPNESTRVVPPGHAGSAAARPRPLASAPSSPPPSQLSPWRSRALPLRSRSSSPPPPCAARSSPSSQGFAPSSHGSARSPSSSTASLTDAGSTHGSVSLMAAYHGSTGTPNSLKNVVMGQLARPYEEATTSRPGGTGAEISMARPPLTRRAVALNTTSTSSPSPPEPATPPPLTPPPLVRFLAYSRGHPQSCGL